MDITADSFAFPRVAQAKTIVRPRRTSYAFAGMISALGLAPGQQLLLQQPLSAPSVVSKDACAASTDGAPPVAGDLITSIKEGLRLNITEIAEVLGVTRPTIYNWIKGKNPPDTKALHRLQTLAAAAVDWKEATAGSNRDFLLDYSGPRADEVTIRETLGRANLNPSDIRVLIHLRVEQYREAYARSREILGEPLPLPKTAPPESARRMNALWAKNAKKLHSARNRNR